MRRYFALALVLTAPAFAQPQAPDTPAGRIFAAFLDTFNSGDLTRVREFYDRYAGEGAKLPPPEAMVDFRARTGGFTLIRFERQEPLALVALLQERDSDTIGRLELSVSEGESPKITAAIMRPIPRPADLALPRLSAEKAVEALTARIDELAAADRFSGVVLVARGGTVLVEKCAGRADRDAGTPVTPDTKFRIGSMNKMFTSVATLQLVETGKISLDDPIGKHLTDYPDRDVAAKVTVRHLLTHTGGTGDIFGPDFSKNRLSLREHSDYVKLYGSRGLTHEPGAQFRYSNYGFILLGAIIERVTGMSYYDAVEKNVFARAGMTATGSIPENEAVPNRSAGYMRRNGQWVANTDTLPWRGTSAGGGYSTARDLLRFAQALEAGTLVSKKLLAEATTAHHEGYGYGFGVREEDGARWYGHGGGAPGMNGDLRIYPTLGYIIVALANLDPPAASRAVDFFTLRMPVAKTSS